MKMTKIMTASAVCAAVLLSGCRVEVKVPSDSETTSQTESSTTATTTSDAESDAASSTPTETSTSNVAGTVDMSTAKVYLSEIEADGAGKKFTYTMEVPDALKLSETLTYDGSDKFTGSSQHLEIMQSNLRFYDATALLGVSEWASLFKEEATGVYDTGIQPAGSFGYPADSPLYTGGVQNAYSTYTDLVDLANAMQSTGGDISVEYSGDIDFSDAEIILPDASESTEFTDENEQANTSAAEEVRDDTRVSNGMLTVESEYPVSETIDLSAYSVNITVGETVTAPITGLPAGSVVFKLTDNTKAVLSYSNGYLQVTGSAAGFTTLEITAGGKTGSVMFNVM